MKRASSRRPSEMIRAITNRHLIGNLDSEELAEHRKTVKHFQLRRQSTNKTLVPGGGELHLDAKVPKLLILPTNTYYRMWQCCTMSLVVYQTFAIPFYMSFSKDRTDTSDIFIDFVFILDLLVTFNVAVSKEQPQEHRNKTIHDMFIMDYTEIAKIYFKGWFAIDLLASLPLDQIAISMQNEKADNLQAFGLLKGLRLPRLLRLVRLLRVLRLLRISPELKRWLQYSRHANVLRLVRLIILVLVTTHFAACIWQSTIVSSAWLAIHENPQSYLMAVYTSLLLMLGENIEPLATSEILYASFSLIIGTVMMAIVFGSISVLVANFTANSSAYQKKMEETYSAMLRLDLPNELQGRIQEYYAEMWDRHRTLTGRTDKILNELSRNLSSEVVLFLRMEMVSSVPFFQHSNPELVLQLVKRLELQIFMKKDYVVVARQQGHEMYFIQTGQCLLSDEIKNPIRRLNQGDYFGAIALLDNCIRKANVQAESFVELCVLSRRVYQKVVSNWNPHEREVIEDMIRRRHDKRLDQIQEPSSDEEILALIETVNQHLDKILL